MSRASRLCRSFSLSGNLLRVIRLLAVVVSGSSLTATGGFDLVIVGLLIGAGGSTGSNSAGVVNVEAGALIS